jgi:hypothetical protein
MDTSGEASETSYGDRTVLESLPVCMSAFRWRRAHLAFSCFALIGGLGLIERVRPEEWRMFAIWPIRFFVVGGFRGDGIAHRMFVQGLGLILLDYAT